MRGVGVAVLFGLMLGLAPTSTQAQFVLRDDSGGWGWLKLTPGNRAIAQLAFGSPQRGEQGRLDERLLNGLRAAGVRRVWGAEDFEPTENQVLAECAAIDYTPVATTSAVFTIHTEVSFWDHTRLAATEIYEAITLAPIAPTDLATDTFVDTCTAQLGSVLLKLGYDQG
jgi:hypothetical protein